ncbi:MAG: class III signal peptide-containing protein [Proteobacteria bacterium]|jgi:Flp pilus assembly pilin Flp|nr:class III signal peptide-containing protein [Pseudomonadota bacterium]
MKNKLMNLVRQNKKGQTSVEYILIIVVIVAVVWAFGGELKTQVLKITNDLFGGISSGISQRIR